MKLKKYKLKKAMPGLPKGSIFTQSSVYLEYYFCRYPEKTRWELIELRENIIQDPNWFEEIK